MSSQRGHSAGPGEPHKWTDAEIAAGAAMIAVLRPLDSETRLNALVIAAKAVIERDLRALLLDGQP